MIFFRFASIVFFFKQKTAYEMRISDWSSDVCSSDLRDQTDQDRPQNSKPVSFGEGPQARLEMHSRPPITRIPRRPRSRPARRRRRPIGRASCRERVCQYVSISVVDVSLKNKDTTKNSTSNRQKDSQP